MGASGPVVTADVWQLPSRSVPGALLAVARDRGRLRALPGARFVKVLGTGRRLDGHGGDLSRWLILASWADAAAAAAGRDSDPMAQWARRCAESWHATLRPLVTRGVWSGRHPFRAEDAAPAADWAGPVAAVTRARLAPRTALAFWRAVPAPAADLTGRPGLCLAIAMGEAPLGVQGTFSVWRGVQALRDYAYARPAHKAVVKQTREIGWYAEELFARFAVLDTRGTVDGRDPLGASG
jgi:hypothetical protein